SSRVRRVRVPFSPQKTRASVSSRRLSKFSAKFSRASGNHCAPGMRLPSRKITLPFSPRTPQKSHTADQNSSGLSMDQRCASEYSTPAKPTDLKKSVISELLTRSGDGFQSSCPNCGVILLILQDWER